MYLARHMIDTILNKFGRQLREPPSIERKTLPKRWILPVNHVYQRGCCETACLKMVFKYLGKDMPIEYLNFVSGYTYALMYINDSKTLLPYFDPLLSTINVCTYFHGVNFQILTATTPLKLIVYAKHVLHELETPVKVRLDLRALRGAKGIVPHAVLLIGFQEDALLIEEPYAKRAPLKVNVETFEEALVKVFKRFGFKELYLCEYFTGNPVIERTCREAIERCARLLKGEILESYRGASLGLNAVETALSEFSYRDYTSRKFAKMTLRAAHRNRLEAGSFFTHQLKSSDAKAIGRLFHHIAQKYQRALHISRKLACDKGQQKSLEKELVEVARLEYLCGQALQKHCRQLTEDLEKTEFKMGLRKRACT